MPDRRCPICGGSVAPPREGRRGTAPFCSDRCRQVDLGRWLSGAYALPAEDEADEAPREDREA